MMIEFSQVFAFIAAIFLLFAAVAWLRPPSLLARATLRRAAAAVPIRESQAAAVFLLLALGTSVLAAMIAVIGMVTS